METCLNVFKFGEMYIRGAFCQQNCVTLYTVAIFCEIEYLSRCTTAGSNVNNLRYADDNGLPEGSEMALQEIVDVVGNSAK